MVSYMLHDVMLYIPSLYITSLGVLQANMGTPTDLKIRAKQDEQITPPICKSIKYGVCKGHTDWNVSSTPYLHLSTYFSCAISCIKGLFPAIKPRIYVRLTLQA